MHPRFQSSLETYNDLAKDKKRRSAPSAVERPDEDGDEDIGIADIESAIAWHVSRNADKREQRPNVQRHIFELQERKAAIMGKLREDLAALDQLPRSLSTNEIRERARALGPDARFVKSRDGKYFVNKAEVSLGTMLTDGEWGLTYDLDPASVPRLVRKRYLVEEAKRKLRGLLDEQIVLDEVSSGRTDDFKRKAYGAFQEMKGREEEVGGWVAERLVKTFLTKLAIDYGLDFEVVQTDVYEDVQNKIDFVIRRKSRARGVKVETPDGSGEGWVSDADEGPAKLGIQLTTNPDRRVIRHKEEQLERVRSRIKRHELAVEDVVLVSLPLDRVRQMYARWNERRLPGGPEELWSAEEKERVFRYLLRDVAPANEIEAQWRMISAARKERPDQSIEEWPREHERPKERQPEDRLRRLAAYQPRRSDNRGGLHRAA